MQMVVGDAAVPVGTGGRARDVVHGLQPERDRAARHQRLEGIVRAEHARAPGVVVHGEGQRHQGGPAIRDWWLAAKAKYRHEAVPLEVTEAGGETLVRARVTGDFPGSPAVLTFTFGLRDGRIADLAIG